MSESEKIRFDSLDISEEVLKAVDKMGFAVRSGQMCAEPLMDRFGVTGMVRVSLLPYNTMEEVERLRAEFGDLFSFDCHRGYPCVDVTARSANKGVGVRAVLRRFGLTRERAFAFGDGANDLDMLAAVGHPIAMGKHAAELDDVCEYVTRSVAQEGIEYGLRHYGLI